MMELSIFKYIVNEKVKLCITVYYFKYIKYYGTECV